MKYFFLFFSLVSQAQSPTLPEARIVAPDTDASRNTLDADTSFQGARGDYQLEKRDSDHEIVGFNFTNHGENTILPQKDQGYGAGPNRYWNFKFPDRARQSIHLALTDAPSGTTSQYLNSEFYFFPRKVLPAMNWTKNTFTVTLPTQETVEFNSKTKEVISGALRETRPLDLNEDSSQRQFAGIEYSGSGIMLRVDKKGGNARNAPTATVSQGSRTCKVPSRSLFNLEPKSAKNFNFPTDEGFNAFLKKVCNMSFL